MKERRSLHADKNVLASNVNELRRPCGVATFLRRACSCAACREWRDGARSGVYCPCEHELPLEANRLPFRAQRLRVPKERKYISSLQKRMGDVDFAEIFADDETTDTTPSLLLKLSSIDRRDLLDAQTSINSINRDIRRFLGSADWTAEVSTLTQPC